MPKEEYPSIRRGGSLMLAWQISNKNVLIVGGGNVAAGRIINVLEADALVTLVCPRAGLLPEVAHRVHKGEITIYKDKEFDETDLEGIDMCLTAIDDPEASSRIWKLCKQKNILLSAAAAR